jgi:ABC-type glycerol-3-phosphate transport system substrate-binding protein
MLLRHLTLPLLAVGVIATFVYSENLVDPPSKDGKVHIIYWEKWTDFEGDAIRETVNEFNRSQNRIHVDLLTISGIQDKTLLAVAGGDPPDVAGLYGPNVSQYADDNAVIPLDDYCRKNGISRDQYLPAYFDVGVIRNHIYSLPSTPASTALHFNKQMMKDAGLDPEKPPQTLEEMDADAKKISTFYPNGKLDKAGFLPAEPGWWNWAWGYFFGGQLWDGKSKITANSPENVRAFDWIQSYSKRYGASNLQSFKSGLGSFSSPQNGFLSGKVAMELQGVWMYNFISKFAPQMEKPERIWSVVPFPHPADRPDLANSTLIDEDVLVIPRGAKHPDEAFEFIKFIESNKGMEMLCMLQRKNTPLKTTGEAFYAHHPNPFIKLFSDLPNRGHTIFPPKMGIWPEYQDALTNAFDQVSLQQKTAKEALDEVQAVMQPKLDEYLEREQLRLKAEGASQ